MENKTKIVIVQRIFPNYRKAIFDKLAEKYNLKLLHGVNNSGIKQVPAVYSELIAMKKYGQHETKVIMGIFRKILGFRPAVIIHEFSIGILSLPFALLLSRLLKINFILWGHGYNRKTGFRPLSSRLDKYRLWLMKKSDAIIVYGREGKTELSKHISSEKIFIAQNTLDTDSLFSIRDTLISKGREPLKSQLKFLNKHNITFIGRLLSYKRPDALIAIYDYILKKYQCRLGVHIIGDGEMAETLKQKKKELEFTDDIRIYGSIHNDYEVGKILFCSDLMVMPGALGASVVHSFAFECPVLSFRGHHGPEIEYVVNNETGFLLNGISIENLAEAIWAYINDDERQRKMRVNTRDMISKNATLNHMAMGFENAINFILKKTHGKEKT